MESIARVSSDMNIKTCIVTGKIDNIDYDYDQLWELHPSQKGQIIIYGKLIETPRYMQSYGHSYTFSKVKHTAVSIPLLLQPFLDWANEQFGKEYNCQFNSLFVNWYVNGQDYINAHSDDEKEHVVGSPIISISLGEMRTFRIRNKGTKQKVMDVLMTDKSYIIMKCPMQNYFTHEVVKVNGTKGLDMKSRINITIRCFK